METKRVYDLEERTYLFAKSCRVLIQKLSKSISNIEDGKQLVNLLVQLLLIILKPMKNLEIKILNTGLKLQEKRLKNQSFG